MFDLLYIGTVIACFLISYLFRDTRIFGFFSMMVFAYLAGDANPNTTTDYPVYMSHYNSLGWETSPFEKGYTELSLLFSHNGYDYAHFRFWFSILAFLILFVGVCLFTKKVALFMGIYGITVFFNDATQIRNLMMIALVILGTGLLAKNSGVVRLIGIMVLLISTQFHDLGFLFLLIIVPLSFIKFGFIEKMYKYFVAILFFLGAIFTVGSNSTIISLFVSFLTRFSSRSNSAENVVTSFGRGNSPKMIVLFWLSLLLFTAVLFILLRVADNIGLKEDRQLKMLFVGSAISMTVVFLIVLAPDYSRISRNSFLFIILLLCWVLDKKTKIYWTRKNVYRSVLFLSLIITTTYANTIIWGPLYYQSIPYLAQILK